ncbi:hypothetical protein LINGRAHAP2_LOCUS9033 [Linum grandiflorum]
MFYYSYGVTRGDSWALSRVRYVLSEILSPYGHLLRCSLPPWRSS